MIISSLQNNQGNENDNLGFSYIIFINFLHKILLYRFQTDNNGCFV